MTVRPVDLASACQDNRFVVSVSGTYDLPRHLELRREASAVGGHAPTTL